ncbi:DNA primase [Sphingorhabdus pulchriflava]|uniref:DNA primase n=1 Tax=Sphingorhabdus pulchriflava TaxID=2292257 RepID=A0A371B2D0_9SPHN|nr:LPD7 domain-containing protein [Sphingorhabdus pulchriflava]RDV01745.1 DNA primase [Sphingorhabdus pulchriflava]
MVDELEGNAPSGRSRTAKTKPVTAKAPPEKPRRKFEPPTITDDLTGKFLRVGNKLYRTSDDKTPIVRIAGDRLKTSNIDALPDIIRIAKANGWTSIKVGGGDKFKKAAYLAAAAQGLAVENYSPSKLVQAEADRLRERIVEREKRREGKKAGAKPPKTEDELSKLKTLSDRFLSQSHAENARDPDLRRAQSLVAQTISIARAKYPDDPVKASKEIEARRQEVAIRIAKGEKIAVVQVRNQQAHGVRDVTQEQALQRDGRSR